MRSPRRESRQPATAHPAQNHTAGISAARSASTPRPRAAPDRQAPPPCAAASRSVEPRIGESPGRIFIGSGDRPCAGISARTASRNRRASSSLLCAAKITSPIEAANAIPAGEPPACTSTGHPCTGRGKLRLPAHRKEFARMIDHADFRRIRKHPRVPVHHQRIVAKTIPQRLADGDELGSPARSAASSPCGSCGQNYTRRRHSRW